MLDIKVMLAQRIVPLFKRGATKLFIGISDITNIQAVEEVRFQTGLQVELIVVEDPELSTMIDKLVEASGANIKNMVMDVAELEISSGEEETQPDAAVNARVDDAPVVKYIQKILLDAINSGCSDIHFEPFEKFYRIRYRQDGVLRIAQPPLAFKEKIASRIKVISNSLYQKNAFRKTGA